MLSAAMLVVGMILSPFLLSLGMWALAAAALWHSSILLAAEQPGLRVPRLVRWGHVLAHSFRRFGQQPALVLLSLLLLVPALSFFWSQNQVYWLERTRVRLPFFVLPWAFANLPTLSRFQYRSILYLLVWVLFVVSIGVAINFALHADAILAGLGQGQPVPVPRHHIRFSLMLVTGVLAGGWLWQQGHVWRYAWERKALLAVVVLLFVFLHVLSVRSGIAALYAALLFSVARFVWRTRRWKTGLAILLFLLTAPTVAVLSIPSLQQRLRYMVWDWQHYQSGEGDDYSDSERWVSLRAGWKLWQESPLLGVGAGDLPMEIQRVVNDQFLRYTIDPKLPHNQFLYIMATTGLVGLCLSLTAFLWMVFAGRYRYFYLYATFQVVVLLSFLVEYTIETSIGVAYYLFYLLWFRKMADVEKTAAAT